VSLGDILPSANLYAVGALSDLAGEITILAGSTYVSLPAGTDSSVTRLWIEGDESACLLVTAEVDEWRDVKLDEDVPAGGLDEVLAKMAKSAGLDVDQAFPFVIQGEVRELTWHVIDGNRLEGGGTSHSDHLAAGVRHQRARTRATLIGFYSPRDHGVFTHRESNTHVHCVLEDPLASGHVDDVILPAGTRIRLPVENENP
jgi:acetolactate decarboxylase